MTTEYRTTCVQFMDGSDDERFSPSPPRGEGWELAHVAAASGRSPTWPYSGMATCALIFYVWKREAPPRGES
jgi:hypothetical protein